MSLRIDVIFDVAASSPYYEPTLRAVQDAALSVDLPVEVTVVRTATVDERYLLDLPDAVVIGPGAPYDAPTAVEEVIRTAREKGLPLVAT